MTEQELISKLDEAARKGAQEVIAQNSNTQTWTSIVMCVIGVCGFITTILFFLMNSQIDKRVSPIERDMALIKQDQSYVKKSLDEIKGLLKR